MNKLKIIPMEWEWLKAGKHCFVFSVVLPNYAENINTLISTYSMPGIMLSTYIR